MKYIAYTFAAAVFAIFLGGGALHFFERKQIAGGFDITDALWLSAGTFTLLGYGDVVPETLGGRITALVLMFGGVLFLGASAAVVAQFMLKKILVEKKNRIIIDVTPDSDLDDALDDLKHLSHLDKNRLSELEKTFEKIFRKSS